MAESAQSQQQHPPTPAADGINAENNHLPGDPVVNVNRPRNNNTNNANNNGNQPQQPVRTYFLIFFLNTHHSFHFRTSLLIFAIDYFMHSSLKVPFGIHKQFLLLFDVLLR